MSKIVKYLREVEDIKKELESYPENIRYYMGYEGYCGSSESIEFVKEKIEEYKNKKNESTKN